MTKQINDDSVSQSEIEQHWDEEANLAKTLMAKQAKFTRSLFKRLIEDAMREAIEPDLMAKWLLEAACAFQRMDYGGADDDAAKRELQKGIREYFRDGSFDDGPDAMLEEWTERFLEEEAREWGKRALADE